MTKIKLAPLSSPKELEGYLVVIEGKEELNNIDNKILAVEEVPRSWIPAVFGKFKGVIIWKGGYLSHVAIIAREFGFPVFRSEEPIPKGRYRARVKEGRNGWWLELRK